MIKKVYFKKKKVWESAQSSIAAGIDPVEQKILKQYKRHDHLRCIKYRIACVGANPTSPPIFIKFLKIFINKFTFLVSML